MSDSEIDALLPTDARLVAGKYWTPVAVARRAAEIFEELDVRSVLDVGSGVGKFCVVAAARAPGISFVGIEQRAHLVRIAKDLAAELRAPNVSFRLGNVTHEPWTEFDALYVFNSFAENVFSADEQLDQSVELSRVRRVDEMMCIERKLAAAPIGTILMTYHGLGGPIPGSYQRLHVEPAGTSYLQVWRQNASVKTDTFWFEDGPDISTATADEVQRCLWNDDEYGSSSIRLFVRSVFARP